jgi:hypothetical protein
MSVAYQGHFEEELMDSENSVLNLKVAGAVVFGMLIAGGACFLVMRPNHILFMKSNSAEGTLQPVRVYKLSEFERSIVGKSKIEVIAALGTPLAVNSGIDPGSQTYNYSPAESYLGPVSFRVVDDATGLEQQSVMIRFDPVGHVENISY